MECSGKDLLGDHLLNGPRGKLQNWVVQGCGGNKNASQGEKRLVLGRNRKASKEVSKQARVAILIQAEGLKASGKGSEGTV